MYYSTKHLYVPKVPWFRKFSSLPISDSTFHANFHSTPGFCVLREAMSHLQSLQHTSQSLFTEGVSQMSVVDQASKSQSLEELQGNNDRIEKNSLDLKIPPKNKVSSRIDRLYKPLNRA